MLHLARIHPFDAAMDAEFKDDEKIGWLRVVYHSQIRWARPAYPKGHYTPPTPEFVKKYAEKLGVWVAPEKSSNEDERDCHLVWFGFSPYGADVLAADVAGGWPNKQFFFTANWEFIVDDAAGTLEARYVDNDVAAGAPTEWPVRFQVSKADKKFSVKLDAGSGPDKVSLELSGVDADTILKLGSAIVHAAVAEKLQALYSSLKSGYDSHTHAPGSFVAPPGVAGGPIAGVSGPPASPAPAWDPAIASSHLLLPDG
jgi:hypothetical protein